MKVLWYVALGSAVGGVARVLVGNSLQVRFTGAYPMGTFIVNITGSLVLGFLMRYALASPTVSAEMRALLTTGFCGGYTTFSTFGLDTYMLVQTHSPHAALMNVTASVIGGLAAVWLGFAVGVRV